MKYALSLTAACLALFAGAAFGSSVLGSAKAGDVPSATIYRHIKYVERAVADVDDALTNSNQINGPAYRLLHLSRDVGDLRTTVNAICTKVDC